ncbi:MAG TPA: c-type cytochrome [Candidatus Methylomirabilis sp.]|nr:c-type cytochrome [Candidatus Methylomirabilis sp.]
MTGKILVVPCLLTLSLFFSIGMASGDYPVEKLSLGSGREIFASNCAGCHGEKGDGSVLKGAFNFTDNELMITKNSSVFFNVVTYGVQDTGMPSFDKLSASQRWDVVAYIWTFWIDNASVEHGKNIYQKNCASCHATNGDSSGITDAFDFTNVSMMVSKEPELLFKNVSDGVKGTPMPPWKDFLSEDERWNTVKYIWTFQFKDYSQILQPSVKTSSAETSPSGEPWYFTPVGMGIVAISIILGIAVLYLFRKGMLER